MKILQVIPVLGCGGAEVLLAALIEELIIQGHQVELVCLYPHHETYRNLPNKEFLEKNIKIHVISDRISFDDAPVFPPWCATFNTVEASLPRDLRSSRSPCFSKSPVNRREKFL